MTNLLASLFVGSVGMGIWLVIRWRRRPDNAVVLGCGTVFFLAAALVLGVALLFLVGGASQLSL